MQHPKLIQLRKSHRFLPSYRNKDIFFTVVKEEAEIYISNCEFSYDDLKNIKLLYQGDINDLDSFHILKYFISYVNQDGFWINYPETKCFELYEDAKKEIIKIYSKELDSNDIYIYQIENNAK